MSQTKTEKLHDLLSEFETAALITRTGRNIHARPMAIVQVERNCDLWFITGEKTAKVHQIEGDTHVHVVGINGWKSCVSISGVASIVRDRSKIHDLWKTAYKIWFPSGPDDPDVILIRVQGFDCEYWDQTGVNALSYLFQTVGAMATGTPPKVKEGVQHDEINFVQNQNNENERGRGADR